jgi:hypothetical protein
MVGHKMHQSIIIIIEDEGNSQDALDSAKYYPDNYGNLPYDTIEPQIAHKLDSDDGMAALLKILNIQWNDFSIIHDGIMKNKYLTFDKKDLFMDKDDCLNSLRLLASSMDLILYEGSPLIGNSDLLYVLYKKEKMWVVVCDAHS